MAKIFTPEEEEEIRFLFRYDPENGEIYRKNLLKWNHRSKIGDVATTLYQNGYKKIMIRHKAYKAHRIAWFLHYGVWPPIIDHINGVRHDNRLINLRETTSQLNAVNSDRPIGSSGKRGVYWHHLARRWQAKIMINGKNFHLGFFSSIEDAAAAIQRKSIEVYGSYSPFLSRGNGQKYLE